MVKILVPIDFSPDSKDFVESGLRVLTEVDEINFVYVIPLGMKELEDFVDEDGIEYARKKAEEKMKDFIRDLNARARKITYTIMDGDPASVLIDLANGGEYDALLIGHRGYAYISDFFIGSVTLKLISKVRIPVIVVRKSKKAGEDVFEER
ncbi:universal stress protein [Thermoplasma sp.]|uniref:universal stress protein n=1 Tax=Thermoplasma sp. TaxID=1973142 RepID=UPI0012781BDC|nr:universal stress protein [Thermoplasma sp.]KAA8921926.1 MAG: universal stress protein [Thermoplasma sp.]